jgi:trk system potassium uptake protein TrkH
MNYASITYVLGTLLIVTGCSMTLPLAYSLYYNEGDFFALAVSALVTLALGLPLWWRFRHNQELGPKDGFFLAVFGWILISTVSALPFMIHGSIPSFTDAFFEMMSGYTTSGATILTDIEAVPTACCSGAPRPTCSAAWGFSPSPSSSCPTAWAACASSGPSQALAR